MMMPPGELNESAQQHGGGDVTAALLVIGDEILSGRTKDKNIGTVADHLTALGIRLREVRIVADDEGAIVEAVNQLRHRYSYVFTTGGIGPTHDDITAESVAKAFGVAIDVDPRAVRLMEPEYRRRGLELTQARLRMARIPDGAALIANSVSIAPGFRLGNVIVMAGVPSIMQAMLTDVSADLKTGARLFAASLSMAYPEADMADIFAAHQKSFPSVIMGSYPHWENGTYNTELVLRCVDQEVLDEAVRTLADKLRSAGFDC